MAKKTKMKKQIKRRNAEIAKVFDCPFCHQKKSVRMKVVKNKTQACLFCHVCNANYRTRLTVLTDPIDVFSEWIDKCQEINQGDDSAREGQEES